MAATAAVVDNKLTRRALRDLFAKILRYHCQRKIDPSGDPGRTPDVAVTDVDLIGFELHLGIRADEVLGVPPMRGGAAPIK